MGVRSLVNLAIQVGFDNDLDTKAFDEGISETLDTMDDVVVGSGKLPANTIGRELSLGDISEGRLLYIEADREFEFFINGVAPTAATLTGSGGSYPTGFSGGEEFRFTMDDTDYALVLTDQEQSLTDVVRFINSEMAKLGIDPIASESGGELKLTSATVGGDSYLKILGTSTGDVLTAFGFSADQEDSGDAPVPDTDAITVKRMADPDGSQISKLKAYVLMSCDVARLFISNRSSEDLRYRYCVVGNLTDLASC